MKILVTGDLAIAVPFDADLQIGDQIKKLFSDSDLNIVNLESPVTESNNGIHKTGPHLKGDKNAIEKTLDALKIDIAVLANNHMRDYGEKGIADTLDFLNKNKIRHTGAGMNLEEASKTLFIETKAGKIAIINFAENEWNSAKKNQAGTNPMDLITNAEQIAEAAKNADITLVIVHGGHENYELPSPETRKRYRFYAEQGADIVIAHHTHCISGFEIHKDIPIYYSLGNFLFPTKKQENEKWYQGLILQLEINKGNIEHQSIPVILDKKNHFFELANDAEKENINNRIIELNKIISNDLKLEEAWEKFVDKRKKEVSKIWSPLFFIKNKYLQLIINKLNIRFLNKKILSAQLSRIRCEAHREIAISTLEKYHSKNKLN